MIGLACSLHPSNGGWEPEEATGGGWRVLAGAALALAVAGLLAVAAWLAYLLAQPSPGEQAAAAAPGTGAAPDAGTPGALDRAGGQPSAATQFSGREPLETSVEHPGGLLLVRVAHHGDGPFALEVRGGAGASAPVPGGGGALVDVTGPYQGSRAFGLPAGTYSYRVGVPAGGLWGLSVEQPRYAARLRLPGRLEGVGDTATRPFEVATGRRARMAWTVEGQDGGHAASARLTVRVLDLSGTVAAEFAAGDGDEIERHLPAGDYLLDVTTGAGVWRVLVS